MNKAKLSDVSFKITKGTTPTTVGGTFVENGINFVKSESVGQFKYLDKNLFQCIDEKTDQKLNRSRLKCNDLLFSIAGAYLGKISIVRESDLPANTNQAVGIVRLDDSQVDVDYIYYYFSQENINYFINRLSAQSSQPNLNLTLLGNLQFDFKPLHVQRGIAKMLSILDEKIALNNRINTELEAMAKLLYDYWFVQFDFPDEEGKPYKSSGGEMVYNERLKREIPVGWEAGNVTILANLLGGGTPKTKEPLFWDGHIPFFTPSDAEDSFFVTDTKQKITESGLDSCSSKLYSKGTVFLTARGTVGKVNIASQDMAMNQSCYALQGKEHVNSEFLYFYVNELVFYIKAKASGSIFKAIVSNDIKFTDLVIPPVSLIQKYGVFAGPIFDKMLMNQQENQHLTSLRDWLLPMLMNGQVRVGE